MLTFILVAHSAEGSTDASERGLKVTAHHKISTQRGLQICGLRAL